MRDRWCPARLNQRALRAQLFGYCSTHATHVVRTRGGLLQMFHGKSPSQLSRHENFVRALGYMVVPIICTFIFILFSGASLVINTTRDDHASNKLGVHLKKSPAQGRAMLN